MTEETYPSVAERVKAILADSVVLISFMALASSALSSGGEENMNARIITACFIFFLYDPLFTSLFGGTIGHMIMGLRVRRSKDQTKNILFPMAIIRFMLKSLLGWISLLSVSGNSKRQAIHDFAVSSVVVYKNPQTLDNPISSDI